jgi:hypothetical protein
MRLMGFTSNSHRAANIHANTAERLAVEQQHAILLMQSPAANGVLFPRRHERHSDSGRQQQGGEECECGFHGVVFWVD